jgi:hypothetical protein
MPQLYAVEPATTSRPERRVARKQWRDVSVAKTRELANLTKARYSS